MYVHSRVQVNVHDWIPTIGRRTEQTTEEDKRKKERLMTDTTYKKVSSHHHHFYIFVQYSSTVVRPFASTASVHSCCIL